MAQQQGGPYMGLQVGMTPEQGMGLDVQRHWANGVQVTLAGNDTFFVFREQIGFVAQENPTEERTVYKNVVSVVMPQESARQLLQVLTSLFPPENNGNAAAA